MKILFLSLLCILLWWDHSINLYSNDFPYIEPPKWNFTPSDYKNLTKLGKSLYFHPQSQWFPINFRKSFLESLDFILGEYDGVIRTQGVNIDDFFHGHILCANPCNRELEKIITSFDQSFMTAKRTVLGDVLYDGYPIIPENYNDLVEVIKLYQKLASKMLNQIINQKLCNNFYLLFHTFESNKPQWMRYGDPIRNILTPVDGKPQGYTPPDIDIASSYKLEFCHILQIPFLIDNQGAIHITIGVDSNMVIFNTHN